MLAARSYVCPLQTAATVACSTLRTKQRHSQPVAPSGESDGTTIDDYAIDTSFAPHELREALRRRKNSSGGDDRLVMGLRNKGPSYYPRLLVQERQPGLF